MSELQGTPGELRAVITIKRKETGKVETFDLVGHSDPSKLPELLEKVRKEKEQPWP